jgi:predicted MFS family arabinose efflux permease
LPYALGSSFFSLLAFIIFYGLDWVATVPPTVRLTTDNFGRVNGPIMFGWIMAAHQLGAAFAAFTAGALYSWLGDYQVAFMSAGVLALIAAGLVIRIDRPKKDADKETEKEKVAPTRVAEAS